MNEHDRKVDSENAAMLVVFTTTAFGLFAYSWAHFGTMMGYLTLACATVHGLFALRVWSRRKVSPPQ